MRVTLRDIAGEAGVSLQTVSNVVRGRTERVSAATTERVLAIVRERGYVPNASARTLAANVSRTIGLFVPAGDGSQQLLSPYDVAVLGGLERELRVRGFDLLLRGVTGLHEVRELVQTWNLAGAVMLEFAEPVLERIMPIGDAVIVSLDAYIRNPAVLSVRSDDIGGGRLAAGHLIGAGHRRLAFMGSVGRGSTVVGQRFEGFLTETSERGCPEPEHIPARLTHDEGYALARTWPQSEDRATAVFAAADILAIGFIQGLSDAGIRVPADVSVIGYDDLAAGQYVTPRLTTIAQDFAAKSAAVGALLFGETDAASPVVTPVTLIERASVAAPGPAAAGG